jgi:antibiotic biosynthesis monooxygenase (ABM) superfamily enzyme
MLVALNCKYLSDTIVTFKTSVLVVTVVLTKMLTYWVVSNVAVQMLPLV